MVKKNDNNRDKNEEFYSLFKISELISNVANISSPLSSEEFNNLNWHTNFMTMMEKSILFCPFDYDFAKDSSYLTGI